METPAPKPKKPWVKPEITKIELREAEGQHAGPLCDKHGALSSGTGC
jgi:hypothetical protein